MKIPLHLGGKCIFDPWKKDDSPHPKSVIKNWGMILKEIQKEISAKEAKEAHEIVVYFYDLNPHHPLNHTLRS